MLRSSPRYELASKLPELPRSERLRAPAGLSANGLAEPPDLAAAPGLRLQPVRPEQAA
jgi:hypothetical protein